MIEKILVPLDGSQTAESILAQVRKLLFHADAEVLLVRAVTVPTGVEGQTVEMMELLRAQAAKYLAEVAARLSDQGARVRTILRTGEPADVILDAAEEEKVSLIAMTTHGRSGLTRWALGSVAEKVLRASPAPVLAVRSFGEGGEPAPAEELRIKKMLVPLSDEPLSMEVLDPMLDLAKLFGSSVTLVHVCEGTACSMPVPELTHAYERIREAGLSVDPVMRMGDPALQVLEACKDVGANLIAMTTHGRRGLSRWMLGSVTEKILRTSPVPLFVVRPAKARVKASKAVARLLKHKTRI